MSGFPWGALLYIVGFGLVITLIFSAPQLLGLLIGSIIRLIKNLFKGSDDI